MENRRTFIKHSAVAAIALSLPNSILFAKNSKHINFAEKSRKIYGKIFHLSIEERIIEINGKRSIAKTINGMLPGPTLCWNEGDVVTLHVTNNLSEPTTLHWHGIVLPAPMDGTPDVNFDPIKPEKTFIYKFKVRQSGTYWYHSHFGFQEQKGVYGAIVIKPKREHYRSTFDYPVILSDWSHEKAETIFRKLKVASSYYNIHERTIKNLIDDIKEKGLAGTFQERKMWNDMSMSDRDLSDVTGYTYTYLMNGLPPDKRSDFIFKKGSKIRLRFINASAMTFFDIRIPGLKMTVINSDGNDIYPVKVDEFRIGVAETYDVLVEPKDDKAYAIFAQGLDRSGYALGNLTAKQNIKADIPPMDPVPLLTPVDMGMMMGHNSMAMDHEMMGHKQTKNTLHNVPKEIKLASKQGPSAAMKSMHPQYRLNDPGVGLRNSKRDVLRYSDLKSIVKYNHKVDREMTMRLTGNMERYIWGINGIAYKDAEPIKWHYGEKVRITFINDTMMNHPMHLHGMWSDVEDENGNFLVRKHTVVVQPGAKISMVVHVDAKGSWPFHCHLLYHMMEMFRRVDVEEHA